MRILLDGPFWYCCPQEGDLKRGDGLVFDSGSPEAEEEGGTIYNIRQSTGGSARGDQPLAELTFGPGQVDFTRIKVGPCGALASQRSFLLDFCS